MQKKTLFRKLLDSKTYGYVVYVSTSAFCDDFNNRELTKREVLGEIYNKVQSAYDNLNQCNFDKDSDDYKEYADIIKKGEKLLAKYNYQHTGWDYLNAIDNEGHAPVFDGVNDDETDLLVTRQIFIDYFETVWQDNNGHPHNAQQLEEVWYLCMDTLEDEGLKVDRNWKPTRAEKKKYIVPKEQEPERYFRLED